VLHTITPPLSKNDKNHACQENQKPQMPVYSTLLFSSGQTLYRHIVLPLYFYHINYFPVKEKTLIIFYFCWFFQKLIHYAFLMALVRNVTLCYGQKVRHRFCDSYVFSDRNLSKWPFGRRFIQPLRQGTAFTVFSPKKKVAYFQRSGYNN